MLTSTGDVIFSDESSKVIYPSSFHCYDVRMGESFLIPERKNQFLNSVTFSQWLSKSNLTTKRKIFQEEDAIALALIRHD